ncbi:MAG: hypothetical protein WCF18_03820 [Chthoniobacteraceae bacterium]
MKLSSKLLSTSISSLIALTFLATAPSTAQAATQTWNNAGATNTWSINALDANWLPGNATWANGNDAAFTNATGETITVGTNLTIGSITFAAGSGGYTITNGANTIDINGAGIANNGVSGQTINSTGIINFNNASSAGNNTSITLSNSGNLNFNGNSTAGGANLSINDGQITFSGTSSAATSTINSSGIVEFLGASTGNSANVSNGGTLDISGHNAGTVTLGSLTNQSPVGNAGAVITGSNKLQVGSLTLSPFSGNLLDFTLFTAGTSGEIIVGGPFVGAGAGQVTVNITPGAASLTSSVYDLIDWTTGTASNVDLTDFALTSPSGYTSGYALQINSKKLQLVKTASVPDGGNTFFLFGAAVLCLGVIGHRRAANA